MTDITRRAKSSDAPMGAGLGDLARNALARLCADRGIGQGGGREPSLAREVLGDPCAAAMAYALCDADDAAAACLVEDLLEAGLSVEEVCLDHLAPAARRLGDLWDRDRLPFTEVALASARIQSMVRRMPANRAQPSVGASRGAIFAAVPGEQHTLGVMMAADLFRRNAWDVGLLVGLTHDELVARMSRDDRPVIGLSCSGDHAYPALRRLLAALARIRPDAHLMVSGCIVHDQDRLRDLPVPVVVVPDLNAARAEMSRIETQSSRSVGLTRLAQGRQRASSAA